MCSRIAFCPVYCRNPQNKDGFPPLPPISFLQQLWWLLLVFIFPLCASLSFALLSYFLSWMFVSSLVLSSEPFQTPTYSDELGACRGMNRRQPFGNQAILRRKSTEQLQLSLCSQFGIGYGLYVWRTRAALSTPNVRRSHHITLCRFALTCLKTRIGSFAWV